MNAIILTIATLCQVNSGANSANAIYIQKIQTRCHKEYIACLVNKEPLGVVTLTGLPRCIMERK